MDYQSFQPGGQEQPVSPPMGSIPQKTFTPKFIGVIVLILILGGGAYAGIWYWQKQQVEPLFTPRVDVTATWKTYTNTNTQFNFEFKYPPQGEVRGSTMLDKITVFPTSERPDGTGATINIWFDSFDIKHDGQYIATTFAGKPAYISNVKSEYGADFKRIIVPGTTADLVIESGNAPIFNQILSTFKFIDETSGWETYVSNKFGFQVQYPPTWEVLVNTDTPINFSVNLRDKKYDGSFEWPGLSIESSDDIGATSKVTSKFIISDAVNEVIRIKTPIGGQFVYARCALYFDTSIIEKCNQILSTFKFTK